MFQGLSTALTALYASRAGLETTGNNIANVNTEGYSRQRVEQSALGLTVPSFWSKSNGVGHGVSVDDIVRLRDQFFETRSLTEHANQGKLNAVNSAFQTIQQAFAEPGENGLQAQLSQFWSAWDDLANTPGDLAARSQVIEQGQTLVSSFQSTAASLDDLGKDALSKVKSDVGQINAWAKNIADLNSAIRTAVNAGETPNNLLDQRDQLVNKLSDVVDVTTQPTESGSVAVLIGGVSLVRDDRVTNLQVDDSGSPVVMRWDVDGNTNTTTDGYLANINGGDIGGQMTVLTQTVPKYKQLLDTVSASLISTVNTQHQAGLDQNGAAGGAFFSGTNASTIAIASALAADPKLLAAAAAGGGALDSENARAMANLASSTSGPDVAYRQLVDVLGVEGQRATRQAEIQQTITNSVDGSRASTSGVNLDEEMTNLVRYQRAYESAAKYMSTMDRMLDTLMAIVR